MKLISYADPFNQIHHAVENQDGTILRIVGDPYSDFIITDEPARIATVRAPIVPTTILGIGLNYRRHAEESGARVPDYPVLFFKGPNAVQHPNQPIVLPTALKSEKVDYECELAVVIGRTCKNVSCDEALDYVLGYSCANDVSARDWQLEYGGGQWSRGKTFDTFCPLGPCLVTPDEIPDPNDLKIRTYLNGEIMQDWHTGDMIFSVPELIAFLSASTTLLPGTVILTGTPHGVGMARQPPRWLRPGDVVQIEVEGIGTLTNPVVEEM